MSPSVIFKPATARNKNKFSALLCNEYHECIAQFESFKQALRDAILMDCVRQVRAQGESGNPMITINGDDSKGIVARIVEHCQNKDVHAICIDATMSLEQSMKRIFSVLLQLQADGKGMRCPGSAYEFMKHPRETRKEVMIGVQNARQWDGNVWDRFIGTLFRSLNGSRIVLILDSKIAMNVRAHLYSEQVTITAAGSQALLGKMLCGLTRMGILIEGDLIKQLLCDISRNGASFDACCTQLKVRHICDDL